MIHKIPIKVDVNSFNVASATCGMSNLKLPGSQKTILFGFGTNLKFPHRLLDQILFFNE